MRGKLHYKCRKCQTVFTAYGVPDLHLALNCLIMDRSLPWEGFYPQMVEPHYCKPDTSVVGVADLIGGEAD
jgi:hypothetical protein